MSVETFMREAIGSSELRTDSSVVSPFLIFLAKLGTGVTGGSGLLESGLTLLIGELRKRHVYLQ